MPTETHTHYDAEGNVTGTTRVTRESEWDDYTRDRALALIAWESNKCPTCGHYDVLVPLPRETRRVTWDEHDGRAADVVQYRCIVCGAADLIKRDWHKRHEKNEPVPGQAAPSDGRIFVAHPVEED